MAFLTPLSDDQRTTFLVVSLPQRTLRRLVGTLGTAPKGSRLDKLSVWDLAWTLVDFYESDPEVAGEVDRALLREVGESPLAAAVSTESGAGAVTDLVLKSPDPLRDLAWAILSSGPTSVGSVAADLVAGIVAEFDEAEERAKEEESARAAAAPEEAAPKPEDVAEQIEKETRSAKRSRERALKRAGDMKARVAEIESSLAEVNRALRAERAARSEAEAERTRVESERDRLRSRLQEGTAGKVEHLTARLEEEQRRVRSLEEDLAEAQGENDRLSQELRERDDRRPVPAEGTAPAAETRADPATWSLPVFTPEFYDSIRAWDRKILRIAFEKIVRLAEDWRHPSLRAIPLEGLPGHYRIRIASDVRLIYRLLEGGRLEILSLIDREDLTRYIRTAKTR